MTYDLESVGWKRILVDGSPIMRNDLFHKSRTALCVSAPICQEQKEVHYITTNYTGGIIEYMDDDFIHSFHYDIFSSSDPFEIGIFNISMVKWDDFVDEVVLMHCIPLRDILGITPIRRINFFILDVEVWLYKKNSINTTCSSI